MYKYIYINIDTHGNHQGMCRLGVRGETRSSKESKSQPKLPSAPSPFPGFEISFYSHTLATSWLYCGCQLPCSVAVPHCIGHHYFVQFLSPCQEHMALRLVHCTHSSSASTQQSSSSASLRHGATWCTAYQTTRRCSW